MVERIQNTLEALAQLLICFAMLIFALCVEALKITFGSTSPAFTPNALPHDAVRIEAIKSVGAALRDAEPATAAVVALAEAEMEVAYSEGDANELVTLEVGNETFMVTRADVRGYDDWCEQLELREYLRMVLWRADHAEKVIQARAKCVEGRRA